MTTAGLQSEPPLPPLPLKALPDRIDTAVIGGGIAGCAVAFELARRGVEVAVLEAGDLAAMASGANSGSLHAQIPMEPFLLEGEAWVRGFASTTRLLAASIELWRGLEALLRADTAPGPPGAYALQAAIAACHARARRGEDTDWQAIATLYDLLAQVAPSPVVTLNRAVAVGMAFGAAAGLELVDALSDEPALAGYHLLPCVRGDLLARLERHDEARDEFERAAAMTRNGRERALLLARAAVCDAPRTTGPMRD